MLQTLEDGTTLMKFSNGFRVIFARKSQTKVATLVLAVGYGSQHETAQTNGTAHFMEHMLFKGSRALPDPKALNAAVARLGGDLTAYTGVETTRYILQTPDASLDEALKILADIVLYPLLREENIKRERGVVAEEIAISYDDPNQRLENILSKMIFGSHPYSFPVAGTPTSINRITAGQLRKAHKAYYTPDNMVLCIVTDKPATHLREQVRQAFGLVKTKRSKVSLTRPAKQRPRMISKNVEDSQAYLGLAGISPAWGAADRAAFEVALSALSGGLHARLPSMLRETLGEVYDVQATAESLPQSGSFGIFTDCEPARAVRVMNLLYEQLRNLRAQPFTADEVDVAARFLEGASMIENDGQGLLGEWLATNLLVHKQFISVQTAGRAWREVSVKAVRAAADKYFVPEQLCRAVIAPESVAGRLNSVVV